MEEIRDLRKKEKFVIDDKYLNGYAKLCGIHATGVYVSLCRHANKQQKCFPSKRLIGEELDISERSVYDGVKALEKWNIIKIEDQGRKKDGSFKVKIYTLLDKSRWHNMPSAKCAVGTECKTPQALSAEEGNTSIKETHNAVQAPPPVFLLKEELEKMKNDKNRHIRIIALFIIKRRVNLSSKEELNEAIKRHSRAAVSVSKFSNDKILNAMEECKQMENKDDIRWTLETVLKCLTK